MDHSEGSEGKPGRPAEGLLSPRAGAGSLLQRDYWGVIDRCRGSPSQVMRLVASHFEDFAPPEIASFCRRGARDEPLRGGDEIEVDITGSGRCEVRVVQCDPQSLTLATVDGHPEAGRITFGAYRNGRGDVVFHIRSRARSSSRFNLLGFHAVGDAMQTRMWTDFVDRVAAVAGRGVIGWIHAEKRACDDEPESSMFEPTYVARGD